MDGNFCHCFGFYQLLTQLKEGKEKGRRKWRSQPECVCTGRGCFAMTACAGPGPACPRTHPPPLTPSGSVPPALGSLAQPMEGPDGRRRGRRRERPGCSSHVRTLDRASSSRRVSSVAPESPGAFLWFSFFRVTLIDQNLLIIINSLEKFPSHFWWVNFYYFIYIKIVKFIFVLKMSKFLDSQIWEIP